MKREQFKTVYSRRIEANEEPFAVLEELFEKLGGLKGKINTGDKVLIKPNFVAPFPMATTDLKFIDFFIQKIRQAGGVPIVGESSGYEFSTQATLKILGIYEFLNKREVEFVNFENSEYKEIKLGNGFKPVQVAKSALEAKMIINLPVLKGHTITKVTGATKNLFGFLSKPSRRYLHFQKLEKGIAALAETFDNVLHFVDARFLLSRAVFGEPQYTGYCLAGLNSFSLDHFGSRLLGVQPDAVGYLKARDSYTVDGIVPDEFPPAERKDSLKQRLHRCLYSAFYRMDYIKARLLGGKSIIPQLHWYLGIHPEIGQVTEQELKDLAYKCPLGAIDVKNKKILKDKCIKARCLKCYYESEPGKIILKGLGRPRGQRK